MSGAYADGSMLSLQRVIILYFGALKHVGPQQKESRLADVPWHGRHLLGIYIPTSCL